ncbi:substrate-binding domain-containing protein [Gracilinema caldarium]|uniref:Periplasmic binding protein/LacI transcriptional regulator n=1 Tax=Gracilinema caldarium (strain ATCC 51460 / DSM 7334 / H1) TaxID=744872 RepID=F8EXX4_GRAC1|nr:substrate-binding domain-containing protein [Gracilinema caldarium]AEJ20138.1 periplasmic binding protein/LacI transcriptional regulator [Gracilinema caldarium DSM 7334]
MKRILFASVVVFVAIIMSVSCTRTNTNGEGYKPIIGLSLDSLVVERWRRDVDSFTRAATDLDATVKLRVANQDADTQIAQIKNLVDSGIDVLVVIPNHADKLTEVCRMVERKGIPVISYDRLVNRANVDLYISFDNVQVGYLMAHTALMARPKGNYIIINGAITDNNAYMINRGYHEVLGPQIATGTIQLVKEIWPSDWISDEVKSRFEMLLSEEKNIDVVLCGNDMLAETVIGVLSENRMLGKTLVLGQDAELSACQRVAEESQYATIYKPIEKLSLKAAALAVMLAKGEKLPATETINDGLYEVPYVKLEPILVTKESLEATVIKDGFHQREDVFRNVSNH